MTRCRLHHYTHIPSRLFTWNISSRLAPLDALRHPGHGTTGAGSWEPPSQTACFVLQPVFGAGFNSGGGFAAFSGASAEAPTPEEGAAAGEEGEAEEECKAEFTPLVQLEEVEKTTGEENEELLLELCVSILPTRAPAPADLIPLRVPHSS